MQVNQQQQQQTVVIGARNYGSSALVMAIIVTIVSFFCGFWPLVFSLFGVGLAIAVSIYIYKNNSLLVKLFVPLIYNFSVKPA